MKSCVVMGLGLAWALMLGSGCGEPALPPFEDAAIAPDLGNACGPCAAPKSKCDPHSMRCVACLADDDCPAAMLCRDGSCVAGCNAEHARCGDAGACDVDLGHCRGCLSSAECTDPALAICERATGRCTPCSPQADLCPAGSYCAALGGGFVCAPGCRGDAECRAQQPSALCCNHACVNAISDARNCGSCGTDCKGGSCCQGSCRAVDRDASNCGACGVSCATPQGVPACVAGACTVGSCMAGFGDCNKSAPDGCEVDVTADVKNCGSCGAACSPPHARPDCVAGTCVVQACDVGFGDCNRQAADGCELDVATDVKNCGACGRPCGKRPHTASPGCKGGQCFTAACDAGWADCNLLEADGCESDLAHDGKNCGACGKGCLPIANANACSGGQCGFGGCLTGFADCNNNLADGCETNIGSSVNNCGACGKSCSAKQSCQSGVCVTPPATWVEQFPRRIPPGRLQHAMTYDSDRKVVVMYGGGSWVRNNLSDTWEWDGVNWQSVVTQATPGALRRHAMVYDTRRKVAVLFGGNLVDFNCPNQTGATWEYDGKDWKQINTGNVPSPRGGPALAYDSARGVTVMFGGGCTPQADTWEYDGVDWVRIGTAHSPPARYAPVTAYDSIRKVVVLYGGWANNNLNLGDTWEYDGKDWTQKFGNGPSPRYFAAGAFSADYGTTMLFAGSTGVVDYSDTWEWDGMSWSQKFPAKSPPIRDGNSAAWDAARGQVVMFGGNGLGFDLNDTWTYGPP